MVITSEKRVMIWKIIFRYCLYQLLHCLIHLILVSIIMFFHFLLHHGLAVIEVWIYQSAWQILIFSKLAASGIFLLAAQKFSFWQFGQIRKLLEPNLKFSWDLEILTVISFMLLALLAPQWQQDIAWRWVKFGNWFFSCMGLLTYYGTDLLVIYFLFLRYQQDEELAQDTSWRNLCAIVAQSIPFGLIFAFCFWLNCPTGENLGLSLASGPTVLVILLRIRWPAWDLSAVFLLVFMCLLGSLIGTDPIKGVAFAPWPIWPAIRSDYLVLTTTLMICYVWLQKRLTARLGK